MMRGSDKKHYVFTLSSEGGDPYSLMTLAAIISLRNSNPEVRVTLVCDGISMRRLGQSADPVLNAADALVEVEVGHPESRFRSRYLKTSVGHLIDGPFLFMDSDTLIRKDLDPLAALTRDCDIAAAPNNCGAATKSQLTERARAILARNGWKCPAQGYFNAGIIWFAGTAASQEFSLTWHRRWLRSSAGGQHFDQPAFNATLAEPELRFTELPITYNAQFKRRPSAARDAAVWHYFASFFQSAPGPGRPYRAITEIEDYLFRATNHGNLDPSAVIRISESSSPWIRRSSLDRMFTRYLESRDRGLTKASVFWLQGRRIKALRKWTCSAIRRSARSRAPSEGWIESD